MITFSKILSSLGLSRKFEKWNELPPEIQCICIQKMDFKTRIQLQRTCWAEKNREISIFSVEQDYNSVIVKVTSDSAPKNYSIQLLPYIFASAITVNFRFHFPSENGIKIFEKIEKKIEKQLKPIRIKNFKTSGFNKFNIFFLKHCWNQIDSIDLSFRENSLGLIEAVKLPSFTTAKMMRFSSLDVIQGSFLFEKLMEVGMEIGQRFKIASCLPGTRHFNPFPVDFRQQKWRDRVIAKNGYTLLRMKTNNPDHHLFMAADPFENGYAYCTVIPANMRNNQLKKYLYWP